MYKKKKILAFMGSAIAAAIPVAAVVSCGSASNEWKYNEKEALFKGGPTLGSFQKDIEKIDTSNGKTWNIVKKQAAFFYYEQEHDGSLNVQKDKFLWEKKKKEDEKASLVNNNNNKKAIDDLNKEIGEIDKKIDEVKKEIATPKSLDYSSKTFSSDYPEILLPVEQIKKKQQEIYDNEKKAFIDKYGTAKDGQAAWIAELSKKYEGANTDEEAVNNLVFKVIKTNAFLRNSIKIDTSYTVKQLKWANSKKVLDPLLKKNVSSFFTFLNIDGYNGTGNVEDAIKNANDKNNLTNSSLRVEGNNDDDKVYFYGSDSKIWGHPGQGEENLKIFDKTRLQDLIGTKSYRMYRHVLLNIKPNSKGRTLPWEASIEEIKKLLALQPTQTDANTDKKYQFQRIKNLWKGMDNFNSKVDQQTGFFLNQVSDNAAGTKNIGGSLGIHKASYFSNGMYDGFALGALVLEKNYNPNNSDFDASKENNSIYSKLSKAIKVAQDEIFKIAGNNEKFKTNTAQNEFIDYHADKVKNIFGTKIREVFDPNAMESVGLDGREKGQIGRSLLYTDLVSNKENQDRFVFISTKDKGGIHLIKRYVVDGGSLGEMAITDLEKMVSEEDTKSSQYNIVELVKPFLKEDKSVKKLINSDSTKGIGKKFKDLIAKKIANKEINLKDLQDSKIKDATSLIDDAKLYINNQDDVKANELASQITSAHSDYLEKALDNKEIAYTPYTSTTSTTSTSLVKDEILLPEDIYGIAYKLADKEKGVN